MPPSKWDEEEESTSPPPVTQRRRFDDEEEEDEVLDSWDAAEDSDVEREKATKAAEAKAKADAEAAANKKTKAQRIEEHRETRRAAAAEEEEEDTSEDEDETDRRARLRRTEKESDLKHAEDLFGDIDLNRMANRSKASKAVVVTDSTDPTNAVDLSAMPLFNPVSKDQFAKLSATLGPLLTAQSKKPHYVPWAQEFVKQIVGGMNSADVRKVSSALSTMSNEKMKEERAADKGSKKSKASKTKVTLNTSRDNKIEQNYDGDDGLGDDDFM